MGRILDDEQLNTDEELFEEYLKEAREKVDPSLISNDEDGMLYWNFRCLYMDCRNHDFPSSKANYNDELRLAAESRVICEILAAREAKLAIAI